MSPAFAPVYFADENVLGLGRLLEQQGRDDVVYPGHPALPEVPLGAPDLEWMPLVGMRGFIVLSRDRRIRTRPAERKAYREHGIRSVWIGAKRDLRPQDQVDLFLQHEQRIARMAIKLGRGPWALSVGKTGVRELPFAME